ncbi:MAG: class D sortase [Acidimicrobiales bacterium]
MRRLFLAALGVALVWGALGAFGYIAGWESHAHRAGARLVESQRALDHSVETKSSGAPSPKDCAVSASTAGQLTGLLEVPAIHLTAPVEQGTTDAVLGVAVGHDPSSVWPGAPGTAALLAHDVSYFVNLGSLRAGDRVVYRSACGAETFEVTHSQVVAQGAAIPDPPEPSIVLDTCYPSNALFFTSKRLLVFAKEVDASPRAKGSSGSIGVPSSDRVEYHVPAPPSLVAEGLSLQQNEAPMGTMTLSGDTSPSWEQSPGPLELEAAALEAYFGGLHSTSQNRVTWWDDIAQPGLAPPAPLLGAAMAGYRSPLDVDIVSTDGAVTSVVLTSVLTLSGGNAPGTYDETVTAVVHGTTVTLGGWTLRPA